MVIQLLNLTPKDIFKAYSGRYNIFREEYQPGLFGLEIRYINENLADSVHRIILREKVMSFKIKNISGDNFSILITGTVKSINEISKRIISSGDEDLGYKMYGILNNFENYDKISYQIGKRKFSFDKIYSMGILNITPDSFSDGGKFIDSENAADHCYEMIEQGADIIDIGGESTRPGAGHVKAEEEISRIVPVIDLILEKFPDAVISADTTKVKVAEAALLHGACIINDVSAAGFEPEILDVVKEHKASLVLMHIKGNPQNMQENPEYNDVVSEIYDFLYQKTQLAIKKGIKNIFIDPGIGFGKTVEHNFELIRRLEDFKCMGFPILIGVSRKSFIGKTLDLEVTERDTATAIIESIAVKNGARIIRSHNTNFSSQVRNLSNKLI